MESLAGFQILMWSAQKIMNKDMLLIEKPSMDQWTTMSPLIIRRWLILNSLDKMHQVNLLQEKEFKQWVCRISLNMAQAWDQL